MQEQISTLRTDISGKISETADLATLEEIRVATLGKKGSVSQLMKGLGGMSPDERKEMGPILNGLKTDVANEIAARKDTLEGFELEARLRAERLDVTVPVAEHASGSVHPVSQVMDEIAEIFASMGFDVAEGPDLEDDFHNFGALNIPEEHPARQDHDTFYLKADENGERKVLRTHTSPVQIRTMVSKDPPIRTQSLIQN